MTTKPNDNQKDPTGNPFPQQPPQPCLTDKEIEKIANEVNPEEIPAEPKEPNEAE